MAAYLVSHQTSVSKLEEVLPYARTHTVLISQLKRQGCLSSKSAIDRSVTVLRLRRVVLLLFLALLVTLSFSRDEPPLPPLPDLYEAGVLELHTGLELHQFTSLDLVKVAPLREPDCAGFHA
jgi:hypothetical protein